MRSETVTTIVPASRDAVFEYRSDIERLPEWATEFARELKRGGEDDKVVNGLGEFYVSSQADPATGVIDMFGGPTKDQMAVFPIRAVGCPTDEPQSYPHLLIAGQVIYLYDEALSAYSTPACVRAMPDGVQVHRSAVHGRRRARRRSCA